MHATLIIKGVSIEDVLDQITEIEIGTEDERLVRACEMLREELASLEGEKEELHNVSQREILHSRDHYAGGDEDNGE